MFIGIDPGAKGAICLLQPGCPNPIITFQDAPQKGQEIPDVYDFLAKAWPLDGVAIEQVRSLPNMSAKSNFSFGYNLSIMETLLFATVTPFVRILPKMWQSGCGIEFPKQCPSKKRKEITAKRCLELYPSADIYGSRGGLKDGRADALMIAHYIMLVVKEAANATK